MAFDAHVNFAYSTVATAPVPALSGVSLVVSTGDGAKFPATPFNAVVCPQGQLPTPTNAEVVRVTAIAVDTLTITRLQESSNNRAIVVGDQIFASITAKTAQDIESLLSFPSPADISQFARGNSTWGRITNVVTTTSTGSQNNFAPGLVSGAVNYIRCNNASELDLTGLSSTGLADGTIAIFESINSIVTFAHQSGSSSAGNKFQNMVTSGVTPINLGYAVFRLDATSAYWRLIAHEQGAGIAVPFSAGNFTANGAMTWTVIAGNINTERFYLRGRILTFVLDLQSATIGGTPNTLLQVTLPNGYTAASQMLSPIAAINGSGAIIASPVWFVSGSGSVIKFAIDRTISVNWAAGSSEIISCVATFELQ